MIEEIIEKDLINIHFQPIISVRTKNIYAFEALCRCTYNGQDIFPDMLFKIAKQHNMLLDLDICARKKAIEEFHKYYLENNDLILFLNFESSLLNDDETLERIYSFIEVIIKLKIPFKNFVLEIKEDEISNSKALNKFCKTYKELDFAIALDDFGTGSSTFDRINLIRPDFIKIDKSLFNGIQNNQVNKEIVKAISKMSHNLGIRVLAEGVEDEESICTSLRSSINLYQGYYFSKPLAVVSDTEKENIKNKILEIASIFKTNNILSLNKKREAIELYDSIATDISSHITKIDDAYIDIQKTFHTYDEIEALYIIDVKTGKQIHNTLLINKVDDRFRPNIHGEEHYLKEYYYLTIESKQGIFLSQKYISYATGSLCKTFAKKIELNNEFFIICLDIKLEKSN